MTIRAVPLPLPSAEQTPSVSFAAENAFWRSLRGDFDPILRQPLAAGRTLISAGVRVDLPETAVLRWARFEISAGDGRTGDVYPRLVLAPSGSVGPLRVDDDGRLDGDLRAVPGGGWEPDLIGWTDADDTAVWDFHPRFATAGWRASCLLSTTGSVVRQTLVTAVWHPDLGNRLAWFAAGPQGDQMAEKPDPGNDLTEPALVVAAGSSVADVRARLTATGMDLVVVTSAGRVVALVDAAGLAALDDAGVLSPTGRPAPSCEAGRPVAEMVEALRAHPDAPGVVVTDGERPIGVVRGATLSGLEGGATRVAADRMPGDPLTELVFACAVHGEQVSVAYYDPANPPRCGHGDLMRRVRR